MILTEIFGWNHKHPSRGVWSAETGNRTQDTTIFSRVLYQLSYLGMLRDFTRKLPGCQEIQVAFG